MKTLPIHDLKKMWTWLRRVSPVRTYHTLERVPDLPESVQDSSGIYYEPFAWWDGQECCWRTWQGCLLEGLAKFLGPWPRSGMTRNGIAYQREPLALPTDGIVSGLLATPRACTAMSARITENTAKAKNANLETQIARLMLPTLSANEYKGSSRKKYIGSPDFHGAKTSEALRTCEDDPIYLNPSFGEIMMGYEIGYTLLETP